MKGPVREANERPLIEAAQKDPARFTALYEDNFERVYAFVARRVGDRADAEDLTSEVFQQALKNLRQFEWRGVPFAAWLYRIAGNAIADRSKRAARETGSPASDDPPRYGAIDVEKIERSARLFRLVNALPAEQRRVIEMRFAEEKSIREIAQELRRTAGAVKQLQFRAIQKLREQVSTRSPRKLGGRNG